MLKKSSLVFFSLIFGMILLLAVGCSSQESASEANNADAKATGETEEKKGIEYPTKPIKLIVPWNAGGDTDVLNRLAAKYLEKELNGTIIITNIGGGSGAIGANEAKKASPDGYTMVAIHDSVGISNLMGSSDISYDDFDPVALLSSSNNIIATHVDSPWNNMEDVVKELKATPGSITFGASLGSTTHVIPLGVQDRAGIQFKIVSYDGTAQRTQALLGQHLDLGTTTVPAAREYIKAKQLKMLGIAAEERNPALPDVPTLKEQGIDFAAATNRGFFFPKGTPQEIIQLVNDALKKVSENPDFIKEMEDMGVDVNFKNTAEYTEFLHKDTSILEEVFKSQGILKK